MLATIPRLFSDRPLTEAFRYVVIHNGRIQVRAPHVTFQTAYPDTRVSTCVSSPRLVDAIARGARLSQGDNFLTAVLPACRVREPLSSMDASQQIEPEPERLPGRKVAVSEFIAALSAVRPVVSDDASRAWSCTVLARGQRCYATNNVILARATLPSARVSEEAMIPSQAVDFILSQPQPSSITVSRKEITVWWEDGAAWARMPTTAASWPDRDLDAMIDTRGAVPITAETRTALKMALDFLPTNEVVRFNNGQVESASGSVLTTCDLPGEAGVSSFVLRKLLVEIEIDKVRLPEGKSPGYFWCEGRDHNVPLEGVFAGSWAP